MISAVARAFRPGCKVDSMLVLEGGQGAGKSSAARILAGFEYFSDNLPAMGTKDASDHVRGKWIIEVGELSAMQKSEIELTKAFISRQEEKFRPAYNRKEITYKRRCVFIGTTNQDNYLRDETGNRRFWPVRVSKIDLAALQRDRDLLWAEAVYWYDAGVKWYLSAVEEALAKEVQADRVSEDIWQEKLSSALEGITEISLTEAAARLSLETAKVGRADQNRITASLRGLGFVREGKFTQGAYRNSARYIRKS
jgi:predicted P-loop ATPase